MVLEVEPFCISKCNAWLVAGHDCLCYGWGLSVNVNDMHTIILHVQTRIA